MRDRANNEKLNLAKLFFKQKGSIPLWLESDLLAAGYDTSTIYSQEETEDHE